MIGFEQRGHAVLLHDRLRPRHALVAHAFGIETLLPIRGFRSEGEFGCILNHDPTPQDYWRELIWNKLHLQHSMLSLSRANRLSTIQVISVMPVKTGIHPRTQPGFR